MDVDWEGPTFLLVIAQWTNDRKEGWATVGELGWFLVDNVQWMRCGACDLRLLVRSNTYDAHTHQWSPLRFLHPLRHVVSVVTPLPSPLHRLLRRSFLRMELSFSCIRRGEALRRA